MSFSKNPIESLPKDITYKGDCYMLTLYVTAWGKLCLAYESCSTQFDRIFSVVVEPSPHRTDVSLSEQEMILDADSLNEAVKITKKRIKLFLKNNQ